MQLAIDVLRWPGMNAAFLFSFFLTTGLALAPMLLAKRRPIGTPLSWGEAMIASVYVFGVLFLAFGIVPDRFIQHADKELGWSKAKLLYGPFDLFKAKAQGGWFPFTLQYEALRDIVVVVIHVFYFGLMIVLWGKWQKRGQTKPAAEVSTYGRPLVKKA